MSRHILLSALAIAALTLAGCGQNPAAQAPSVPATSAAQAEPAAGTTIPVLASTSIIADVVGQVGGELVSVSTLVPLGGDTHSFEPTPQDVARVTEAKLIFVNGAGYEEFLARLLESAGGSAQVVELSEGLTLRAMSEGEAHSHEGESHSEGEAHSEGESHATTESHSEGESHATTESHSEGEAHSEGESHATTESHAEGEAHSEGESHAEGMDPHTWTDPNNVKYWTAAIVEALSAVDAANAATYQANAERYNQQLTELDTWIGEQFAQVPENQRLLVTDHAVFGYMADRYGLRQVGTILPGSSSVAAASAQELAALQDEIRALEVKAIFVGDVVNQNLAQRLADDTGTQMVEVLTESLTPADGPGATYLDYMRHNVSTMVEALR